RSLVLEWVFCSRCGEGALKAETDEESTRVAAWDDPDREDGFDQTLDRDDTYGAEAEEEQDVAMPSAAVSDRRYLRPWAGRPVPRLTFDALT
ncbi:hypothetical protein L9G16_20260, partial [Shewanella sp. A25]|nr:hypothetical protein [Shewanella shenzhenensis]